MRLAFFAFPRYVALLLFICSLMLMCPLRAGAVVTASGDVDPVPPTAGGTVSGELIIGKGNNLGDILFGSMTVNGGSKLTDSDGIVGDLNGAFGQVLLSGAGSQWNHADEMTIGDAGWGQLSLDSMARSEVADDMFIGRLESGRGEVFMDNLATLIDIDDDLEIGSRGVGYLQALGGSQIRSGDAWIGRMAGSDGHVLLRDSPTQWTNLRDIIVGGAGIGRLEITLGARVNQRTGIIGESAGSFGSVAVLGAQTYWSHTTDLTIGGSGTGELLIGSGGQVVNRIGTIGSTASGRGTVNVVGTDSRWRINSQLFVGTVGTGFLNLDADGLVSVIGAATVGTRGQVSFNGGRLAASSLTNNGVITGSGEITSSLANGSTGEVRVSTNQSLRITGAVTNTGRLEALGGEINFLSPVSNNGPGGQIAAREAILRFDGGLENNSTLLVSFGETDIFGPVRITDSGHLHVAGDAEATIYDDFVNEGLLTIDPDARAVFGSSFSSVVGAGVLMSLTETTAGIGAAPLAISGSASLGGGLDVQSRPDFALNVGDTFTLLSATGGVNGTFAATALPPLETGLAWSLMYGTHDVILNVIAAGLLQGDFNGSGSVEQGDLDLVLLNWGQNATPPPLGWVNDFPVGLIDQAELDRILLNWGATASVTTAVASIPEPSALTLSVWAMLVLTAWQAGRRNRFRAKAGIFTIQLCRRKKGDGDESVPFERRSAGSAFPGT